MINQTTRCSITRSGRFIPGNEPGTHCTGSRVGPRAGRERYGQSRPQGDSKPIPYTTTLSRLIINNNNSVQPVPSPYIDCANTFLKLLPVCWS